MDNPRLPVPLTAGTYTTVVDDTLTMSPSEAAPDTPRPVRMLPKLMLPGMSTDIMRRLFLSRAALSDRLGVAAVTYMMSVRQQVHAVGWSVAVQGIVEGA